MRAFGSRSGGVFGPLTAAIHDLDPTRLRASPANWPPASSWDWSVRAALAKVTWCTPPRSTECLINELLPFEKYPTAHHADIT